MSMSSPLTLIPIITLKVVGFKQYSLPCKIVIPKTLFLQASSCHTNGQVCHKAPATTDHFLSLAYFQTQFL